MSFSSAQENAVLVIVAKHSGVLGPLLPILHDVQKEFGFIPREAIILVANALNLSRAEVYGVVSFYHDFRNDRAGEVQISICRSEACQAMGSRELSSAVMDRYCVAWNKTSEDGRVTLSSVYCLGLCSVAPAVRVNDTLIGKAAIGDIVASVEGKT